jgi:hypothetical protein
MTMTPDQKEPTLDSREASASEIEAVAEQLVALVEEFEAALSEGYVPPAFAERLAELRQAAERSI